MVRSGHVATNLPELSPDQLRQACDPAQFSFHSTDDLQALEDVIGQERALRAIAFGIDITTNGYHMYALGPTGTGKRTTVHKFLEHEAAARPVPDDWLYVNNFTDADKPRALRMPPGMGRRLKDDMDTLVEELRSEVPRIFESQEYSRQQEQMNDVLQKRNEQLLEDAGNFAQTKGFAILHTPQGFMIAPATNGNVLTPEQIQQLDEATQKQLEAGRDEVQVKLREVMRRIQQFQREARERGAELDRQMVSNVVDHYLDELKERYAQYDNVTAFLGEVHKDILENVPAFKAIRQMEMMRREQAPIAAMLGRQMPTFEQYRANLIVDNREAKGAPVVQARNPSYHNLVGRIEHEGEFGTLVTNFNMIKSGLLHKANGGYLLIDVRDLFTKPLAWEGLKRALKNKVVEIESMAEAYGLLATRSLSPEPIPVSIKVVLIGDPMFYYLLYNYDPDFHELFKVKVDFSARMARTQETIEQYARFIATVVQEDGLLHFDPSGVARVVEHGSRLVAHQRKLATKFGDVVDLIRQSSYWARKAGHSLVSADDVEKALEEKVYRSNQLQQILEEAIAEGVILINADGERVGQVNGLAVLSLGDYAFGKPSRISARVHVGTKGVISIDREIALGGPIHNKGALILTGYLGGKYATEQPMALSATLTFEQTYEEIEGDSASCAELYALVSALSGFPVRQDLAITGSVNQYGEVQAIGGVNEKIEGVYDVFRQFGLTGRQGVLIPQSNVQHLMLRQDIVDAVRNGQFHIYPVTTIDEGIALLTGREAGNVQLDGTYPEGSVNQAVQRRLQDYAMKVRAFMKSDEDSGGESKRAA